MVGLLEDSLNSSDNESEFSLLTPDSEASKDDGLIYLSVRGQTFVTVAETLQESEYLQRLTSQSIDKRCFVDADPELFKHILRYLRDGQYPLFYETNSGFDYGKYHDLLLESKQLKIQKLVDWIEQEKFKEVVKVSFQTYKMMDVVDSFYMNEYMQELNQKYIQEPCSVQLVASTKRRYVCPREIPVHRELSDCGRKCLKARIGTSPEYIYKPCYKAYVTKKFIKIDQKALDARN